jgi:hypothetical protein
VNKVEFIDYLTANDKWPGEVVKDDVSPGKLGYVVREHEGERVLDVMRSTRCYQLPARFRHS